MTETTPQPEDRLSAAAGRVFVANLLAAVAAFGTTLVTARALGPAGRGEYAIVVLSMILVVTFASLGIFPATAYHVARETFDRRIVVGTTVFLSTALGAAASTLSIGLLLLVEPSFFRDVPRSFIAIALCSIPFGLLTANLQGFLLGLKRFLDYNASVVAQATMPLVLVTIAVYLLDAGVGGAILATGGANAVVGAGVLVWCSRLSGRPAWVPDWSYMSAALSYGLKAHLNNVLSFLGYRLDAFLLGGYTGPASVGIYSIAVAVVERLWSVSYAVSTVLFPRVATERNRDLLMRTPVVMRHVVYITFAGAVGLYFISESLLTFLYSESFAGAAKPLQILLPGIVLMAGARVLANDLAARGRPLLNSAAAAVSVLLNVVLNVLLIPRYGINGAAWASTISYSAVCAMTVAAYCFVSRAPLGSVVSPSRLDFVFWRRLAQGVRSRS